MRPEAASTMRTLYVAPAYLPAVRHGGPIYSVHGLAKRLAQRGLQVLVFTHTDIDGLKSPRCPSGSLSISMVSRSGTLPAGSGGNHFVRWPARALARMLATFDIMHFTKRTQLDPNPREELCFFSPLPPPTLRASREAIKAARPPGALVHCTLSA